MANEAFFLKSASACQCTYLEEFPRASRTDSSVLDLRLFSEVLGGLDRRLHAFDGQERGQVSCVRRDDDQREKPPDSADYAP